MRSHFPRAHAYKTNQMPMWQISQFETIYNYLKKKIFSFFSVQIKSEILAIEEGIP